MTLADCYKLLELPDGASHSEVKAARRRLLMQWHPDKVAHNPAFQETALERSKQINMAADFLTSQPDPTSDYVRQRDRERVAEQERVERERRKAEDRRRQEETQRQQQQDAEEARQRRQDAEDRRWQEEERERVLALEEEWQAQWKAEVAQKKAQREAEAAQGAEQARQREATKKTKAVRTRFWGAAFWVVVIIQISIMGTLNLVHWYATHPAYQTPETTPQQVYSTPQGTTPAETATATTVQEGSTDFQWLAVSNDWINSDQGSSLLGHTSSQVHQLLGMPTATVNRFATSQDDLWFPGTAAQPDHDPNNPAFEDFVSVIYKNGRVIQIENDVTSFHAPERRPEYSTFGATMNIHPRLQTATISYSDLLTADTMAIKLSQRDFDVANISRDEAMHFLGKLKVMYYDDVNNGIAFLVKVSYVGDIDSDYGVTADTQPDRIIVHTPGMNRVVA